MSYQHDAFKLRLREVIDELAAMITQKNLAYGNSYEVVPQIMKILYPGGIPFDQIDNALTIVRLFDKIKRIVTDNDPLGEDPWSDIAGYAILKLVTRPKEQPQVVLETQCTSECTGRCRNCDR